MAEIDAQIAELQGRFGDPAALVTAKSGYLRALALQQQLTPNGRQLISILQRLGGVFLKLGDPAGARPYLHRGLALAEAKLPISNERVALLQGMGAVERAAGNMTAAVGYYERALAAEKQLLGKEGATSTVPAEIMQTLGDIARQRGDLAKAGECYAQALVLEPAGEWGNPIAARSLYLLGETARERGDLTGAKTHYESALAQETHRAAWTRTPQLCQIGLAAVARAEGDPAAAVGYEQAASLINLQVLGETLRFCVSSRRDVFPPMGNAAAVQKRLAGLGADTLPKAERDLIFFQPGTKQRYQPNAALSNQKLADIKAPATTVVFSEVQPAPDGSRGVLFVDGHTARMPAGE